MTPNARRQARLAAGAQRTLYDVACMPSLGWLVVRLAPCSLQYMDFQDKHIEYFCTECLQIHAHLAH